MFWNVLYICKKKSFFAIIFFLLIYRPEEQKAHPQEVVNSLKTYAKSIKRKSSTAKFMLVATTIRESDELLETQPSPEGDGSKNATHEKDVFSDGKAPIAGSEEVRKEVIPPEFALVLHCFF